MAFTYVWNNAIEFLRSYARNIPVDKISAQICDAVSSEMWSAYPWPDACTTIPPTTLLDNIQDYSSPPTFFKLVSGQIVRILPQPFGYEPLEVMEGLAYSTMKAHPSRIRQFSNERGEGVIRLEYPPIVNAAESFELRGTYQLQHTRVDDTADDTWFKDQLWHVAQEGLLYWGYKLGNNYRAAGDQYKLFRLKLKEAWEQDDAGSAAIIFPAGGSITVEE